MRDSNKNALVTRSMRVVRGALIAFVLGFAVLAAYQVNAVAQTTEASQTQPQKKIEAGIGIVSDESFKFGEYNGLQNQGPVGLSSFDFRGGAAYDSGSAFQGHESRSRNSQSVRRVRPTGQVPAQLQL
jgi:hypothetical protein